jgi:metal-responsive CopG/Arc/MetJ family transcriptional regulator
MVVPRKQVLVQFTDALLERLDDHAASAGRSRSDVIREAIERYLDQLDVAEADRRLVEAYTRMPQEDDPYAEEALRELIQEEPW